MLCFIPRDIELYTCSFFRDSRVHFCHTCELPISAINFTRHPTPHPYVIRTSNSTWCLILPVRRRVRHIHWSAAGLVCWVFFYFFLFFFSIDIMITGIIFYLILRIFNDIKHKRWVENKNKKKELNKKRTKKIPRNADHVVTSQRKCVRSSSTYFLMTVGISKVNNHKFLRVDHNIYGGLRTHDTNIS